MVKSIVFVAFTVALAAGNQASAQCWRLSGDAGLGNSNNVAVVATETFGGSVYVGTSNEVTGCQVLRTTAAGNPPYTWEQVNTDGFGDSANGFVILTDFAGYLYAATSNDVSGAQIFRTQGVGAPPFSWDLVNVAGFGIKDNEDAHLSVFNGWLYAGTVNSNTGG